MKLDEKVQDIIDLYNHTTNAWAESRAHSMTCYEFCMNEQWTTKERAYLAKTGRMSLVYNMITPRLHNLYGTEQTNRRSARIRPSSNGQQHLAEILNGMYKAIWEINSAEFEIEKVFLDGLICKLPGSLKIDVVPDELGFLSYRHTALNPFSVHYDPDFRRYDLKDCKWIIEESWQDLETLKRIYPSRKDDMDVDETNWIKDIVNRLGGLFGAGDVIGSYYDKDGDRYKVLETQRREVVKRKLLRSIDTGGYVHAENDADAKDLIDRGHVYITDVELDRIRVQTIIPYFNIMVVDEIDKMDCDMFNIIPYFSFDYNNLKSKNNSLVYALLDPQRNLNKREIQKSNFIDHAINSPTIFSYEDKEAKELMDEQGNRPGLNILVRNLKFPPRKLAPGNIGMDIWNDMADAVSKMNDISGVNDTARGQSEYSNESGKLFAMKAERTGATLNPYFRNLSKTRKLCAEYFLKTVRVVYGDDDRPVDIMNRKKEIEEIIINHTGIEGSFEDDVRQFRGRVILDEAEYSPTKLQENMQTKLVMAQMMPPEFVNWEYILRDSELADVEEWINYINGVRGIQADQAAMSQAQNEEQVALEQLALEKQLTDTNKETPDGK